jgi:hypothetical protein
MCCASAATVPAFVSAHHDPAKYFASSSLYLQILHHANALAVQVFHMSNGPRYAAIDIHRSLYLANYIHDKLAATSSMQLYSMDWIELFYLSHWYLSITAMVPSIRSSFSGVQ